MTIQEFDLPARWRTLLLDNYSEAIHNLEVSWPDIRSLEVSYRDIESLGNRAPSWPLPRARRRARYSRDLVGSRRRSRSRGTSDELRLLEAPWGE